MNDEYLTIESQIRTEIKVKGSKFIGTAVHIESKSTAEDFILKISKEFFDATHNCFAYKINEKIFRIGDAGEPSGTAGKPILSVIENKNLFEILIIVTRYFGGTKLGTGGLIRAYSDCANKTLLKAKIIKKFITQKLTLNFSYEMLNNIMRLLNLNKCQILESKYEKDITLKVAIRLSKVEEVKKLLIEASSGKILFVD
jgi:uncharacterized YigZ family protein